MNQTKHTYIGPWVADQGDGTYKNPILHADYSDPDVVALAGDYYMTASSFGHVPGLPILHSNDLVNWKLINYAIKSFNIAEFNEVQHGNGVWAPSIRYYNHKFWIFYGDPDRGIYMLTADHPAEEWTEPLLIKAGKGLIDPCPFWDEDGSAYLIHAYAQSRSGIKHKLNMCQMKPDGTALLDDGVIIIDAPDKHPTIEGPKMLKLRGYYYIFAPAGGVEEGWQTVLRAKQPLGPYEDKIVMHQGNTPINGPHQGGYIQTAEGEEWFIHFQHKDAYGRIVHLQPVTWVNDWPMMGQVIGEGIGEPVLQWKKPSSARAVEVTTPPSTDDFAAAALGLQWQWQANPMSSWYSLAIRDSYIRLYAEALKKTEDTLFQAPHLLLQKFPALQFEALTLVDASQLASGERAGLIIFGYNYSGLAIKRVEQHLELQYFEGDEQEEKVLEHIVLGQEQLELKVEVNAEAQCQFSYSIDLGQSYQSIENKKFQATVSKWVGAKLGIFAEKPLTYTSPGYAEFDYFIVR